jgi:hypothetical protein
MKVVEGDTFSINGTTGALDFKFRLLTWEDGLLITKGDQVADSVAATNITVDTLAIDGEDSALVRTRKTAKVLGILGTGADTDLLTLQTTDTVYGSTYTAGTGVFKNEHRNLRYYGLATTAGSDENVFTAAACPP